MTPTAIKKSQKVIEKVEELHAKIDKLLLPINNRLAEIYDEDDGSPQVFMQTDGMCISYGCMSNSLLNYMPPMNEILVMSKEELERTLNGASI